MQMAQIAPGRETLGPGREHRLLAAPFPVDVQMPEGLLTFRFMGNIYILKVSTNFKEIAPYKTDNVSTL